MQNIDIMQTMEHIKLYLIYANTKYQYFFYIQLRQLHNMSVLYSAIVSKCFEGIANWQFASVSLLIHRTSSTKFK